MEHSYGIIPLQKRTEGWFVFIVHRIKSGGFWEFPKGHLEEGENSMEAAVRELKEETGLSIVKLLDFNPLTEYYEYEWQGRVVPKEVHYYLAFAEGAVSLMSPEVDDGIWVLLEDAENYMTYDTTRSLCHRTLKIIRELGDA